jgi:protein-tyrosine phosphatase
MSRSQAQSVRILMICMGNICRSPTAEGVFRHRLLRAGLMGHVEVDSAGTHAYHVGSPPDARSQEHAALRGYDLSELRARQVQRQDFERFDLLLAMDWDNLALLEDAAPPGPDVRHKLRRLTEFIAPDSPHSGAQVVPDPYYGGPQGFDHVLDLVEAASDGLLAHVQQLLKVRRTG